MCGYVSTKRNTIPLQVAPPPLPRFPISPCPVNLSTDFAPIDIQPRLPRRTAPSVHKNQKWFIAVSRQPRGTRAVRRGRHARVSRRRVRSGHLRSSAGGGLEGWVASRSASWRGQLPENTAHLHKQRRRDRGVVLCEREKNDALPCAASSCALHASQSLRVAPLPEISPGNIKHLRTNKEINQLGRISRRKCSIKKV